MTAAEAKQKSKEASQAMQDENLNDMLNKIKDAASKGWMEVTFSTWDKRQEPRLIELGYKVELIYLRARSDVDGLLGDIVGADLLVSWYD